MLTENWDKVGFRALQGSWGIKILKKKKKKTNSRAGCGSRSRRITQEFEAHLGYIKSLRASEILSQKEQRNISGKSLKSD